MKFFSAHLSNKKGRQGFTLIEMLVSIAIFTFVMLITTSAIFTIVASNKKAESLKSVMDNLSFALESMTRNIRTGSSYDAYQCPNQSQLPNCPGNLGGSPGFEFASNQELYNGNPITIEYYLSNGQIMQNEPGNPDWSGPVAITASEINITRLDFYLVGSGADGYQPSVLMTVIGTAGVGTTQSQFKIQTTLSQRQIDS